MLIYIKELIVVLGLSGLVFAFAKSPFLSFMEEADFSRRRNIWIALSTAAFLTPSFWLFVAVSAPLLYWGGKKDTNPLALYLLVANVIPDVGLQIPTDGFGINQLFNLDLYRLASLCILVPAAWQIRNSTTARIRGLKLMDILLLSYGALHVVLYVPPDLPTHVILHNSPTNALRAAFLFLIDNYLLYYVASRSLTDRRTLVDAFATFCLACTVMSSIAIFESVRHWLLYSNIHTHWNIVDLIGGAYTDRAGLLRAQASSGNPLALGYLLAIAFGLWQYLKSHVTGVLPRLAVPVLLLLGLFASFARGPWLGAVAIFLAFSAFRPGGARRLLKSTFAFLLISALVLASPLGTRIRNSLPFLGGKVAENSLTYRERLLDRSWELIQAHPYFGDQHAFAQMQDLRQGQGIIDIVDTYVEVTLFYGFFGLALFLGFILLALAKAYRATRRAHPPDPDWRALGASLAACILGTVMMLADCSFLLGYVILFFVLAGAATAYSLESKRIYGAQPVSTTQAAEFS